LIVEVIGDVEGLLPRRRIDVRRRDCHWELVGRKVEEGGRREADANSGLAHLGGDVEVVHGALSGAFRAYRNSEEGGELHRDIRKRKKKARKQKTKKTKESVPKDPPAKLPCLNSQQGKLRPIPVEPRVCWDFGEPRSQS
jgi:hypothetical protein